MLLKNHVDFEKTISFYHQVSVCNIAPIDCKYLSKYVIENLREFYFI